MRVLFSTTAGLGHFLPMVPIAQAALAAGHQVVVAAPESFRSAVVDAGLEHLPFADPDGERMAQTFRSIDGRSVEESNRVVIGEVFVRLDAQAALPGVTRTIASWRPDVVVRDPAEFASLVAAAAGGVPQVQVAIGLGPIGPSICSALTAPLEELCTRAGLERESVNDLLARPGRLTSVPASLDGGPLWGAATGRHREGSEGSPTWRYRIDEPAASDAAFPRWGDPEAPLVYVTFGSVVGGPRTAGFYTGALTALAELPIRVLLTTGPGLDPAALDPVPPNALVERWRRQADVMPLASAVVGHGGFGTTMTAVRAGVPQVVTPLFAADNYVAASALVGAGAGLQVLGLPETVGEVAVEVARLLSDTAYRERAEALAQQMRALPSVASCVDMLVDLVGSQ
ncbi:MAG: glycosyltransferase [Nostocoides sp.]